jgi:mRNA interferase MazF
LGDVFFAELGLSEGAIINGLQPVVVSNNTANRFSPTITVAGITSQFDEPKLPTHVKLGKDLGFDKDSIVLLEQIRTIDKQQLKEKVVTLGSGLMESILLDCIYITKRRNAEKSIMRTFLHFYFSLS